MICWEKELCALPAADHHCQQEDNMKCYFICLSLRKILMLNVAPVSLFCFTSTSLIMFHNHMLHIHTCRRYSTQANIFMEKLQTYLFTHCNCWDWYIIMLRFRLYNCCSPIFNEVKAGKTVLYFWRWIDRSKGKCFTVTFLFTERVKMKYHLWK